MNVIRNVPFTQFYTCYIFTYAYVLIFFPITYIFVQMLKYLLPIKIFYKYQIKEISPVFFKATVACSIANHGCGRSRNIASISCFNSAPNPSKQTSLSFKVTKSFKPCFLNSVLAIDTRCS